MSQIVVCAMYKFVTLEDFEAMRKPLLDKMQKNNIKGTLILANEGINGTIAGYYQNISNLLNYLKSDPRLVDIDYKTSYHKEIPFYRSKVKLKKEIVTLGINEINPNKTSGEYVEPKDWNNLISNPETLVIDTRNKYEIEIGTFNNAVNPNIERFCEFPKYVTNNLNFKKNQKIAMFCTGGIRCEKSTALLKTKGFNEVYHLKGGILKYLEEIPKKNSMWQGECFVFDSRVAVNHKLEKGNYDQCFACRMPITENDKKSTEYVKGISCHYCYGKITKKQKNKFIEREKQFELSKQKGFFHLGDKAKEEAKLNKFKKMVFKKNVK